MSEPLTSHEIEDVLSSIRRLVSEELRPGARAAAPVATPTEAPVADAGKLMLTPALRVVADSHPVATKATAEAEAAPLAPPVEAYDDEGWNQAAGQADPVQAAPVPADPIAAAETPAAPEALAEPEAPAAPAAALDTSSWPEPQPEVWEDGTEILWSSAGSTDDAVEDEAEVIASAEAMPGVHGHWSAQDLPGVDWVQEESDWVEPEPMPFVAHPRKSALTDDPLARAWADRAEAEVRAELGDAATARKTPFADAAQPEAARADAALADARPAPESGPGLFDGEDPEIDEEVLRDIVRDIIREELAGTLGERITRNVRKLVRVEINRALTAREFE
jgi:hypothetical protein